MEGGQEDRPAPGPGPHDQGLAFESSALIPPHAAHPTGASDTAATTRRPPGHGAGRSNLHRGENGRQAIARTFWA